MHAASHMLVQNAYGAISEPGRVREEPCTNEGRESKDSYPPYASTHRNVTLADSSRCLEGKRDLLRWETLWVRFEPQTFVVRLAEALWREGIATTLCR